MARNNFKIRMCSSGLSGLAFVLGFAGLFSNNWLQNKRAHFGFIKICVDDICTYNQDTIPDNDMKVTYVIGMILVVCMPQILLVLASVIQAITLRTGASRRLDLSSAILLWISSYHGVLLTIILIGYVKIAYTNFPELDPYVFGWSAYISLLALLLDLASAITCTIYSVSDKNQREDNIPLTSDYD